jgi:hypothetical protein
VKLDKTLAPRAYCSIELSPDERFRITVLDGQQVPDIVFFRLDDLGDRLSPTTTQLVNGSFVIAAGHTLYGIKGTPLLIIEECSVDEGVIVGGSCSGPANYARFGVPDTPNCRTNLIRAGREYGLEEPDVSHIYCPFMSIKSQSDGSSIIDMPACDAGDYVEFRALTGVLALVSNCPQERAPTNAFNPTRLHVWAGNDSEARPSVAKMSRSEGRGG